MTVMSDVLTQYQG